MNMMCSAAAYVLALGLLMLIIGICDKHEAKRIRRYAAEMWRKEAEKQE